MVWWRWVALGAVTAALVAALVVSWRAQEVRLDAYEDAVALDTPMKRWMWRAVIGLVIVAMWFSVLSKEDPDDEPTFTTIEIPQITFPPPTPGTARG